MALIHLSLRDGWASRDLEEGPGGEMTDAKPHSLCG